MNAITSRNFTIDFYELQTEEVNNRAAIEYDAWERYARVLPIYEAFVATVRHLSDNAADSSSGCGTQTHYEFQVIGGDGDPDILRIQHAWRRFLAQRDVARQRIPSTRAANAAFLESVEQENALAAQTIQSSYRAYRVRRAARETVEERERRLSRFTGMLNQITLDETQTRSILEAEERSHRRSLFRAHHEEMGNLNRDTSLQRLYRLACVRKVQRWMRRMLLIVRELQIKQKRSQSLASCDTMLRMRYLEPTDDNARVRHWCAARIQCAYRRICAQRWRQIVAAVLIQATWRMHTQRRRWPKLRDRLEEQVIVSREEAVYRKGICREESEGRALLFKACVGAVKNDPNHMLAVRQTRDLRQRDLAVLTLQRAGRGMLGRVVAWHAEQEFRNTVATRIQSMVRGWSCRRLSKEMRVEAADYRQRQLEARWRIYTDREQIASARVIQRAWRHFLRVRKEKAAAEKAEWPFCSPISKGIYGKGTFAIRPKFPSLPPTSQMYPTASTIPTKAELGRKGSQQQAPATEHGKQSRRKKMPKLNEPTTWGKTTMADLIFEIRFEESAARREITRAESHRWDYISDLIAVLLPTVVPFSHDRALRQRQLAREHAAATIQKLFRGHRQRRHMQSSFEDLRKEREVVESAEGIDRKEMEREESNERALLVRNAWRLTTPATTSSVAKIAPPPSSQPFAPVTLNSLRAASMRINGEKDFPGGGGGSKRQAALDRSITPRRLPSLAWEAGAHPAPTHGITPPPLSPSQLFSSTPDPLLASSLSSSFNSSLRPFPAALPQLRPISADAAAILPPNPSWGNTNATSFPSSARPSVISELAQTQPVGGWSWPKAVGPAPTAASPAASVTASYPLPPVQAKGMGKRAASLSVPVTRTSMAIPAVIQNI